MVLLVHVSRRLCFVFRRLVQPGMNRQEQSDEKSEQLSDERKVKRANQLTMNPMGTDGNLGAPILQRASACCSMCQAVCRQVAMKGYGLERTEAKGDTGMALPVKGIRRGDPVGIWGDKMQAFVSNVLHQARAPQMDAVPGNADYVGNAPLDVLFVEFSNPAVAVSNPKVTSPRWTSSREPQTRARPPRLSRWPIVRKQWQTLR